MKKCCEALISLEIEKPREHIEALLPSVNVMIVSNVYLKQRQINAVDCMDEFTKINLQLKIVITQGSNGLIARYKQSDSVEIKGIAIDKVIDSIGAGDCFIAGLISRLSQQQTFNQALTFANNSQPVRSSSRV